MFTLVQERPQDGLTIENLYEAAFGPGRKARTAERLRENNHPVADYCFIAEEDGALAGTVRFWPILAGSAGKAGATEGLLLGPLAVQPHRRRNGMGLALVEAGIARAKEQGVAFVLLVGDEPYYAKAGFVVADAGRFEMPGPVDATRLLVRELNDKGAQAKGAVKANPDEAELVTFAPPAAQQCAAQ